MRQEKTSESVVKWLRGGIVDRKLPNEFEYRGLSISRTVGVRLRIVLEWLVQSSFNHRLMRRRLRDTRKLRDKYHGEAAVILATGPSLQTLDVTALKALRSAGAKVFALNFFSETAVASDVRPDYYVLADPVFLTRWESSERSRRVWDYISKEPRPIVCVPAHCNIEVLPGHFSYLYFNGVGLNGWSKNISPLRPRGFLGLTAYHAISIALFLGHDPVFTLGIDNDVFKSVGVGTDGEIFLGERHAYPEEQRDVLRSVGSVAVVLEDAARYFADLRLFPAEKLINLAPESLITEYGRGNLQQWINRLP